MVEESLLCAHVRPTNSLVPPRPSTKYYNTPGVNRWRGWKPDTVDTVSVLNLAQSRRCHAMH